MCFTAFAGVLNDIYFVMWDHQELPHSVLTVNLGQLELLQDEEPTNQYFGFLNCVYSSTAIIRQK